MTSDAMEYGWIAPVTGAAKCLHRHFATSSAADTQIVTGGSSESLFRQDQFAGRRNTKPVFGVVVLDHNLAKSFENFRAIAIGCGIDVARSCWLRIGIVRFLLRARPRRDFLILRHFQMY